MATYTVYGYGSSAPTGMTTDVDTVTALELGQAFYILSGSYDITGVKVWLPSDGGTGTYSAYLWSGGNMNVATQIASATFPAVTLGAWNTVSFPTPTVMTTGYYWVTVHFPNGRYAYKVNELNSAAKQSVELSVLYMAVQSEVTPGNGGYNLTGTPGAALNGAATTGPWYGIDPIIVDHGSAGTFPTATDAVTISDSVTAVRGGLPAAAHLTGSATDTVGASGTATTVASVGSGTSTVHSQKVSMFGNRIWWGSPLERVNGPTLASEGQPIELGLHFRVKRPTRITGCRVYKHPSAAGTVPVTLWSTTGAALASTTLTWTADGGGWRQATFGTPYDLPADTDVRISYYTPNGYYGASPWYFNAQEMYEPPFWVRDPSLGICSYFNRGSHAYPDTGINNATNYWIDVQGEFVLDLPAPSPTPSFMGQWTNYTPNAAFPVGVYYADPPYLADYYDMGVNTIFAVPISEPGYREAILSRPNMDVWASGGADAAALVCSDPELADHVVGYVLGDEPDMAGGLYQNPQAIRDTLRGIRLLDSTRPSYLNFGTAVAVTAGWAFLVPGKTLTEHMTEVLAQMDVPDLVSVDYYNSSPKLAGASGGIWDYFAQVRRVRQFTAGLKPVWAIVESTLSEVDHPTPEEVEKTTWASLIAGAKGIVYFDHRFAFGEVTQDFAAMLHNTAMKAKVTALAAQMQALAGPLLADEANLVTASTSSNTTAGPLGGTYGVPIEYTTRQSGGKNYLFTMAARPGTTTATFTVPSAANKTLTRKGLGETGTVAVGADGIITQSYGSDYEIHLYEWTP